MIAKALAAIVALLWTAMALWLGAGIHAAGEVALAISIVILALAPFAVVGLLICAVCRAVRSGGRRATRVG